MSQAILAGKDLSREIGRRTRADQPTKGRGGREEASAYRMRGGADRARTALGTSAFR